MTLTKGTKYDSSDSSDLTCTGWTKGDGTGREGYNVADYFRDGIYQGADEHGIEPEFDLVEAAPFAWDDEARCECGRIATDCQTHEDETAPHADRQ